MIIKSMSRKSKSFSQLYDYLMRDEKNFCFTRNTYLKDKKNLVKEFMKNSEYLKNTRGKNFLYHELLSLEENNLTLQQQKEILLDLANKYLEQRANNHLSFGVVHEDKKHIHLHLMISANEIFGEKRVRISKNEFADIQKNLENYKNERYSELTKSAFYQTKKDFSKEKNQEQEIKHKRNAKTIKDKIKEDLTQTFKKASSKTYLDNHLKSLNYEIYQRGQTVGITYENKNYRLKTLGLEQEYINMLKEFEYIQKREIKRQSFKDEKINQRIR